MAVSWVTTVWAGRRWSTTLSLLAWLDAVGGDGAQGEPVGLEGAVAW